MMADLLDICRFTAGNTGTGAFEDGTADQGFLNLDDAGAVNGKTYPYRAENATRTEWEIGYGVYDSGAGELSRTPLKSSNSNAAVSFTTAPTVIITPLRADIIQVVDIVVQFNGGGAAIATGVGGYLPVDFDGEIIGWTLVGDQSGSMVVDVWKDTYANYPPTVGDSIAASAKPTISAAIKGQSSTLTGWTTTFSAGDVFGFNIDSNSAIKFATLSLKCIKT